MHNVTTSLSALHPDWSVVPIGPQNADPSINAGVLTLLPRIDDGAPLVYFFQDNTFQDANKDFGLVFKLALSLGNNTNQPIEGYVVDLFGDVTDGQGNTAHPGFAHFHTGGDAANGFTATGYVMNATSVGSPLADINAANRAVLTGNPTEANATETWAGGRVHQYEGSFQMIVTPLVQADWAGASGVDFKTLPYTFTTEHYNPTFAGTAGNDFLYGWESSDNNIRGQSGHDVIMGTEGDDTLDGEAGVDRLFGGFDNDTLFGGLDQDWLEGGHGLDVLDGGDGDDRLIGGAHDDTIDGGSGSDTAAFSGARADYTIRSQGGTTTVTHDGGLDGTDTLTNVEFLLFSDQTMPTPPATGSDLPVANPLSSPPAGVNRIDGNGRDNHLNGTGHGDGIRGFDGNDGINGNGGDDFLFGGNGRDRINGGDGNDHMRGNNGNDDLRGGRGDDEVYADRGNDQLRGGAGNDVLWGGRDHDRLFGEDGDDVLMGEQGNDRLTGGDGNDVYVFAVDGGDDRVIGWASGDQLAFDGLSADAVTVQEDDSSTLFSWSGGSVRVDEAHLMQDTDYVFA